MHLDASPTPAQRTLAILRGVLVATLTIGLVGILAELILLEHTEETWQRLPIFMIISALIVLSWHALDRGPLSVRVLQGLMSAFVLTGAIGVALHFRGNIEFELEMQPSLIGMPLFWNALRGATPTLAPGAMAQLGLIGLAYTFRHPALRRADRSRAAVDAPRSARNLRA